jgi:hypothetical protein
MVLVLGFAEDEWTFFMFAFVKDKLHNRLSLHLDTTICIFAQKFYTQNNFLYHKAITTWKDYKVWIDATT